MPYNFLIAPLGGDFSQENKLKQKKRKTQIRKTKGTNPVTRNSAEEKGQGNAGHGPGRLIYMASRLKN